MGPLGPGSALATLMEGLVAVAEKTWDVDVIDAFFLNSLRHKDHQELVDALAKRQLVVMDSENYDAVTPAVIEREARTMGQARCLVMYAVDKDPSVVSRLAKALAGATQKLIIIIPERPDSGDLSVQFKAFFTGVATIESGPRLIDEVVKAINGFQPTRGTLKSGPAPAKKRSSKRATSTVDWVDALALSHGASSVSRLARRVLERAATINSLADNRGEITTTRLFIALLQVNDEPETVSDGEDGLAVSVLGTVRHDARFAASIQSLIENYVKPDRTREKFVIASPTVTLSSNMSDVFRRAVSEVGPSLRGRTGHLQADDLLAALLVQPDGKLEGRLVAWDMKLSDLRIAVGRQVADRFPNRADHWRNAFQLTLAAVEPNTATINATLSGFSANAAVDVGAAPNPTPTTNGHPDAGFLFARLGNDVGGSLDDKLGVEDEARAFAAVAAARDVPPPLAFGIFGAWGSGKSFFMRLMQKHVAEFAKPVVVAAPGQGSGGFHQNIVSVNFNAWHYAESNLWASLVDHIFMELDRWLKEKNKPETNLFDSLSTAREMSLEAAANLVEQRRQQKAAAARLEESERRLREARSEVRLSPRTLWQALHQAVSDVFTPMDMQRAVAALGLTDAPKTAASLKAELDSVLTDANEAAALGKRFWSRLRSAPSLIVLVLVIVATPLILVGLRQWLIDNFNLDVLAQLNQWVTAGIGVVAAGTTWLAAARKRFNSAVDTIKSYENRLDQAIDAELVEPLNTLTKARQDEAQWAADVEEAKASLAQASERLTEATKGYAQETGSARLLHFVSDRATGREYGKHLGLVAAIRKDFAELSTLLEKPDKTMAEEAARHLESYKQRVEALIAVAEAEKLPTDDLERLRPGSDKAPKPPDVIFERIILYIDDLDRCPPETVAEVLQAVHLLLTFPLFVVVVAVDVRWVSRSLETHYRGLVGGRISREAEKATPSDYLEKIFQVPYWVRPMTAEGSRDLLTALAGPLEESPAPPTVVPAQPLEDAAAIPVVPARGDTLVAAAEASTESVREPVLEAKAATDGATSVEMVTRAAKALTLTSGERAFMREIAGSVGTTPRRALRFINVYRVVKASLDEEEREQLENDGGYRALMIQLAIATGSAPLLEQWLSLVGSLDKSESLSSFQTKLSGKAWFKDLPETHSLRTAMTSFATSTPFGDTKDRKSPREDQSAVDACHKQSISLIKFYSDIAKRYSFVG
jgi:hypothetical protein